MSAAEQLKPMMADVGYTHPQRAPRTAPTCCSKARRARCSTSTTAPIPYVTSSNCVAGNAAAGSGVGPGHAALHPRHHQGLHHARRRRAVPDRAADGRAGHGRPPPVDRRPGARHGDRPAAPLRLARRGAAQALDHHQRHLGPVHHQARRARRPARDQGLRRLRAATASASTSCRWTPTTSSPASRSTRRLPGWSESDRRRHRNGTRCR